MSYTPGSGNPGTSPFRPTCQNTDYRWCGKHSLKLLSATAPTCFPSERFGPMGDLI